MVSRHRDCDPLSPERMGQGARNNDTRDNERMVVRRSHMHVCKWESLNERDCNGMVTQDA